MKKNKQKFYESPYVTADTVIFTVANGELRVLLIERKDSPFAGWRALPGVFLLKNEKLEEAASRALRDKVGLKMPYLEQLYTFDSPTRDPRGHVISVAYFALLPQNLIKIKKNKKLQNPQFFPSNRLPRSAFDHKNIIQYAVRRLCAKLEYTNAASFLLPRHFALSKLQEIYEAVLGRALDKRNFRKKFLSLGLIKPTRKKLSGARQRPAQLYEFISRRPAELKRFF